MSAAPEVRPGQLARAWAVHLLTASGAPLGVIALLALGAGDLSTAGVILLVALAIDSVDGTLARRFEVARVVPKIDGRRLDDIVDFLNYTIVPSVFLVAAGSVSHWAWAALPALASAYGFSQTEAKTEDDFFLGWPSYWNVLALYLWLLEAPAGWGNALVATCALLVFVPFKYIYPSKMPALRKTTGALAGLWLVEMTFCVIDPVGGRARWLPEISLFFVVWYIALSFWLGRRSAATERPRVQPLP